MKKESIIAEIMAEKVDDLFDEWFNEFEIYIMSGCAKNVVKNSPFGKQLIRLKKSVKNK